jgi:hypothetical protein
MRNRIRDTNPLQEALRQARWRRDQAQVVVQAWKASGQTMDEFTEKHDLRFDRLNNWAQRFHSKKTAGSPEKLTSSYPFIETPPVSHQRSESGTIQRASEAPFSSIRILRGPRSASGRRIIAQWAHEYRRIVMTDNRANVCSQAAFWRE